MNLAPLMEGETLPKSRIESASISRNTGNTVVAEAVDTDCGDCDDGGVGDIAAVVEAAVALAVAEVGVTIEELVPSGLTSAQRLQHVLDHSSELFQGRYDSSSVCTLLATLEETDLRTLRDHLHAALPDAVPSAGGRPLARRNVGSICRLAEDCWALGSSIAQGILTHRAASATLRPAERAPLAPHPPVVLDHTTITSSFESLISTQLHLEQAVSDLQTRSTAQATRLQELQHLRGVDAEKIMVLEAQVSELIQAVGSTRGLARGTGEAHPTDPAPLEQSLPVAPRPITSVRHRVPLPPPSVLAASAAPSERHSATGQQQPAFAGPNRTAGDIAGTLELQSLGQAIAAALHERAGDNDSEPDRGEMRRLGAVDEASLPPPQQFRNVNSASQSPAQWTPVIGAGPASDLVATADSGVRPTTASFVLEGIHPDATDAQVRNLVWPIVRNLHDFQRLSRHIGVAAGSKAYRIEVDTADTDRVLDPASWPAGLRVRPWTEKRRGRSFPATQLAPGPQHQQLHPGEGGGGRSRPSASATPRQQQPRSGGGDGNRPQRGHGAPAVPQRRQQQQQQQQQQQPHFGEGGGRSQRGYWAPAAPQQQQPHFGEGVGRSQHGHWAPAAPQQQQPHFGEGGGRSQRGYWAPAAPQQQPHFGESDDGRSQRDYWAASQQQQQSHFGEGGDGWSQRDYWSLPQQQQQPHFGEGDDDWSQRD